jgi:hypothetical protein
MLPNTRPAVNGLVPRRTVPRPFLAPELARRALRLRAVLSALARLARASCRFVMLPNIVTRSMASNVAVWVVPALRLEVRLLFASHGVGGNARPLNRRWRVSETQALGARNWGPSGEMLGDVICEASRLTLQSSPRRAS